jgi:hypothetical protein
MDAVKNGTIVLNSNDTAYDAVKNKTIVFDSNDTISGVIKFISKYNRFFKAIAILPFSAKWTKKSLIGILRKNIKYIRVYPDDLKDKSVFADYYYIKDKDWFARLLKERENIGIWVEDYDFSENTEHFVFFDLLLTNKKNNTLRHIGSSNFIFSNKNKLSKVLLRSINKRYKQHFSMKDFKDEQAMIDYILDKENERLNNQSKE